MSWAWRSFLVRSHPLLHSSIRPVRRHGTVFGRGNLIGSRGYASNSSGDATTKPHLYVVLDDQKDGFGVHKIDLRDDDNNDLDRRAPRRLTQPPVLRVALVTLGKYVQFAAVGTSIVAIGETITSPALAERWMPDIGCVLIYDTKTTVLTVTPHLPAGLFSGYKAAMAVEDCLYMLGSEPPQAPVNWHWRREWVYGGGSLHCLTTHPPYPDDYKGDKFWGWEHLSYSSPWLWSNFRTPPMVPFLVEDITAYGARASPQEAAGVPHELLVSLRPTEMRMLGATYSFSTTAMEWTRRFEWHLPVLGRAHYDSHLDVWVGLHAVNEGDMYGPRVTDGHLCIGKITSSTSEWKVSNDKFFRFEEDTEAGWRHIDAKLVPVALAEGGSEYCLMERLRREGELEEDEEDKKKKVQLQVCWGEGGKCLLRLTPFHVERGQDGEPTATTRLPPRSYEVCWHDKNFDAQIFWM